MSETTLNRSRAALTRLELIQHVLRDVAGTETATNILGARSALPMALAPTGFTRLMHHQGEEAVARAAARHGVPYSLSTLGTVSVDSLASAVPGGRHWFQLYVSRDRSQAWSLVQRAQDAAYEALIVTVDAPVGGMRGREVRNGLTIPPRLTTKSILDISQHPRWWWNALTTEPLEFASIASSSGTVGDLLTRMFDPSLTWRDLDTIRELWSPHLIVKGIMTPEDAARAIDAGADAIVVSNHGGRQLDLGAAPLDVLPSIVSAVDGRCEVYIDGGFMTGAEVVGAVALGATAVLIGRAYLYGLMAGGEAGVDKVLTILAKEVRTTMQLVGAANVHDLSSAHVRLRPRS